MTALVAGCLLGLSGSLHCAAMCGPLLVAIGQGAGAGRARLPSIVAYHTARVSVYILLAVPAGLVGHAVSLVGFGRAAAVVSGLLLIAMAPGAVYSWVRRAELPWIGLLAWVSHAAWRSTPGRPIRRHLAAGVVNGLLPCGLVYPAAIAAAAMGSLWSALLFMVGFGCGTLPAMFAISWSAGALSLSLRAHLRWLTPAALVLTGVLLIARGLAPTGLGGHGTVHVVPPRR